MASIRKRLSGSDEKFIVYELKETYHELGRYRFRIVLNPKFFKAAHGTEFSLVDSDRSQMSYDFQIWGRKIICEFTVDESVADGVALAQLKVSDDDGQDHNLRISFWIIKP